MQAEEEWTLKLINRVTTMQMAEALLPKVSFTKSMEKRVFEVDELYYEIEIARL